MTGTIDRVSQCIICINDNWSQDSDPLPPDAVARMPIAPKRYIVASFFSCPGCHKCHHIGLVGFPPQWQFLITHFVPVDDRQTDISDLKKIAQPKLVSALDEAKRLGEHYTVQPTMPLFDFPIPGIVR